MTDKAEARSTLVVPWCDVDYGLKEPTAEPVGVRVESGKRLWATPVDYKEELAKLELLKDECGWHYGGWAMACALAAKDEATVSRLMSTHPPRTALLPFVGQGLDVALPSSKVCFTVWTFAARYSSAAVVKVLVSKDWKDDGIVDGKGRFWTALALAAIAGKNDIVTVLLEAGAAPTIPQNEDLKVVRCSAVCAAFSAHRTKLALKIFKTDKSPHATTAETVDGVSVLSAACAAGNMDVVKAVLENKKFKGIDVIVSPPLSGGDPPIVAAARRGRNSVVAALVKAAGTKASSLPWARNAKGETPLFVACRGGFRTIVDKLLDLADKKSSNNRSKLLTTKGGATILHGAVLSGAHELVKKVLTSSFLTPAYPSLVTKGGKLRIDAKDMDAQGRTALWVACERGYTNIVRVLIPQKAAENAPGQDDSNQKAVIGLLVNQGDSRGRTPLEVACARGHKGVVDILLEREGVNLRSRRSGALRQAMANGHTEIATKILSKEGAASDTFFHDAHGRTLLNLACRTGDEDLVKAVLAQDDYLVSRTDRTPDAMTALHAVSQSQSSKKTSTIISSLLAEARCPDVNVELKDKRTPLFVACAVGHVDAIRKLLECGAKPGKRLRGSRTTMLHALMGAVDAWENDEARLRDLVPMIGKGKNFDQTSTLDDDGMTPLHIAAIHGNAPAIRALAKWTHFKTTIDPNARTSVGSRRKKKKTGAGGLAALHLAVTGVDGKIERSSERRVNTIKALVENLGADVNVAAERDGATPLIIACRRAGDDGAHDVIECLLTCLPSMDPTVTGQGPASTVLLGRNRDLIAQGPPPDWAVRLFLAEAIATAFGNMESSHAAIATAMALCAAVTNKARTYLPQDVMANLLQGIAPRGVSGGTFDGLSATLVPALMTFARRVVNDDAAMSNLYAYAAGIIAATTATLFDLMGRDGESEDDDDDFEEERGGNDKPSPPRKKNAMVSVFETVPGDLELAKRWIGAFNDVVRRDDADRQGEFDNALEGMSAMKEDTNRGLESILATPTRMFLDDDDGEGPLLSACRCGRAVAVKYLIENFRDHETLWRKDKYGRSPFYIACEHGQKEVVDVLWNQVDDPTKFLFETDLDGETPLMAACRGRHLQLVLELLDAGDPRKRGQGEMQANDGTTCLHIAADMALGTAVVEALHQNATPLNAQDERGRTAVYRACALANVMAARRLVQLGADINLAAGPLNFSESIDAIDYDGSGDGWTPLHAACDAGHVNIVGYLLDAAHAAVDQVDAMGRTPLHLSCQLGRTRAASLLLAKGADRDLKFDNGISPLAASIAAPKPDPKIVAALLANGAKVHSGGTRDDDDDDDDDESRNLDVLRRSPLLFSTYRGLSGVVKNMVRFAGADKEAWLQDEGIRALRLACQLKKHVDIVVNLLEAGVKGNNLKEAPLLMVAQRRNQEDSDDTTAAFLKALLKHEANAEVEDEKRKWRAIHFASAAGFSKAVSVLAEHGAKIGAKDSDGLTPLHLACAHAHAAVAEVLCKKGALLDDRDDKGRLPLHVVGFETHGPTHDVLKVLLENGADANSKSNGLTALGLAVTAGDVMAARLLLQKGATAHRDDTSRESPLAIAAGRGHGELVQLLLEKGANDSSRMALEAACDGEHADIAKMLMASYTTLPDGINLSKADRERASSLWFACAQGSVPVVKVIYEHIDTNLDHMTSDATPLDIACQLGHVDVVEYLLDKKADFARVTHTGGETPLHTATKNGKAKIAKLLCDRGLGVNLKKVLDAKNSQGETPLHYAAKHGKVKVLNRILQAASKIKKKDGFEFLKAKDKSGQTPLHHAIFEGHSAICFLLLDADADPYQKNNDGVAPRSLAYKRKVDDIIRNIFFNHEVTSALTLAGDIRKHRNMCL